MKRVFSAALLSAVLLLLCACGQAPAGNAASPEKAGSMELQYAEHFNVDYYADGSAVLTLGICAVMNLKLIQLFKEYRN